MCPVKSSARRDLRRTRNCCRSFANENLAARDSGRLFRLFIGTVCARSVGGCPCRYPPLCRFLAGLQTATPSHLWIISRIRRPSEYYAPATHQYNNHDDDYDVYEWKSYASAHVHARLHAYALRRRDYVHPPAADRVPRLMTFVNFRASVAGAD